jgi:tRNA pseudouridine55 synthase
MHGFLIIDKPEGFTSHDVVARVRRLVGMRQVGHTGTLDPFATGVLVVACGAATKAIPYLAEEYKVYQTVLRLGETTDTQDRTGVVVSSQPYDAVDAAAFRRHAEAFVGQVSQLPPMYSAVKQGGVPLYRLARKGQEVERTARQVHIAELSMQWFAPPDAAFTVTCSKGTYVRTLVHDLGIHVGCGAHVRELRRLASGPFQIEQAVSLEALHQLAQQGKGLPVVAVNHALAHLPVLTVSVAGVQKVLNGLLTHELIAAVAENVGLYRVVSPAGELLAIARFDLVDEGVKGRLLRVFPELYSLQH